MKLIVKLLPVLALSVTLARSESTETNAAASGPIRIGAMEAQNHYDETVIVTGKVAQVSIRPTIVFLNIDKPHPDSPFSAVIFPKNTNDFGDLKSLKGKSVEITGKIKEFKDAPEIILSSTNQLTVLTNTPPADK